MSKIGLIIQREYLTRVRKTSFMVMTLLGPVIIAGMLTTIIWLGLKETDDQQILVADQTLGGFADLKDSRGITFDYFSPQGLPYQDVLPAAQAVFKESGYTSLLFIPKVIVEGTGNAEVQPVQLFFKKQPSAFVQNAIETQLESIVELHRLQNLYDTKAVDPEKFDLKAYKRIKADVYLSVFQFKEDGNIEEVMEEKAWVGWAFGILIYLFILIYAVQVMRGVIEEKTNRIVEVVISSVRPFQLMMGKIIGVGLVALTQFVLWVLLSGMIVFLVQTIFFQDLYDPSNFTETGQVTPEVLKQMQEEQLNSGFNLHNPNNIVNRINFPLNIGLFLFYFLGGYLLYSALFAAVGSAVDAETDTQQFMLPLTAPLSLAYMVSLVIIGNPHGPLAVWFSTIPFTSPVVMLVRINMGLGTHGVAYWELFLSMGLLVITFLSLVWVAARIYRTGILMYGKRASWKEIIKWVRY